MGDREPTSEAPTGFSVHSVPTTAKRVTLVRGDKSRQSRDTPKTRPARACPSIGPRSVRRQRHMYLVSDVCGYRVVDRLKDDVRQLVGTPFNDVQ